MYNMNRWIKGKEIIRPKRANSSQSFQFLFFLLLLNLFFSLALRSLFLHKYHLLSKNISLLWRIIKGTQIIGGSIYFGEVLTMIINVLQFIINAFLKDENYSHLFFFWCMRNILIFQVDQCSSSLQLTDLWLLRN